MAMENLTPPATFRNLGDVRTLLATLEELAVAALDESDDKRRAAIIWAVQKLCESGAKDVEALEAAAG